MGLGGLCDFPPPFSRETGVVALLVVSELSCALVWEHPPKAPLALMAPVAGQWWEPHVGNGESFSPGTSGDSLPDLRR